LYAAVAGSMDLLLGPVEVPMPLHLTQAEQSRDE
jgi:hypothetical protein